MLLHIIDEFTKDIPSMNWTTGTLLNEQFEKCLDSRIEWNPIMATHPYSIASFHQAVKALIVKKFPSDAWQKHKDMLMSMQKPFKMSPYEFLTMIHFHNGILELLPG